MLNLHVAPETVALSTEISPIPAVISGNTIGEIIDQVDLICETTDEIIVAWENKKRVVYTLAGNVRQIFGVVQ